MLGKKKNDTPQLPWMRNDHICIHTILFTLRMLSRLIQYSLVESLLASVGGLIFSQNRRKWII